MPDLPAGLSKVWAGVGICLVLTGTANAAKLDPDLLTTSGRAGLPSAAGTPLAGKLQLGAIKVSPDYAARAGYKSEELAAAFRSALDKSLANYGYRSGGSELPVTLDVEVRPLEMGDDKAGATVVANVVFTSADAQGANSACFPFEAVGRFHALKPLHAGGHQRTVAFLAVVGLAAAGVNASMLFEDQLASARARDAALNSRRNVGVGEDVAPGGSERDLERFGAINALQVAGGALIAHLGEPGGCNAPAGATNSAPTVATTASADGAGLHPGSDVTPAPKPDPTR